MERDSFSFGDSFQDCNEKRITQEINSLFRYLLYFTVMQMGLNTDILWFPSSYAMHILFSNALDMPGLN